MQNPVKNYIRATLSSFVFDTPFPGQTKLGKDVASVIRETARRGYIWGMLQHVVPNEQYAEITLNGTLADAVEKKRVHSYITKEKVSTKLSKILSENHIPCAIIRGIATASSYPEPIARIMSDIDILVPETHMETARTALEAEGIQYRERRRSQLLFSYSGIKIEVHKRLITFNRFAEQNAVFDDWPAHIRKIALENNEYIYALSREYGLVADIFHAFTHHDLEKMLYVVDIACQATSNELNWNKVWELTSALGIENYVIFSIGYTAWVLDSRFRDQLPQEWQDRIDKINPSKYEPFWKRATGFDSLWQFLARRRIVFQLTKSPRLRFKQAWRMCFGEDMKIALLYSVGKRRYNETCDESVR